MYWIDFQVAIQQGVIQEAFVARAWLDVSDELKL